MIPRILAKELKEQMYGSHQLGCHDVHQGKEHTDSLQPQMFVIPILCHIIIAVPIPSPFLRGRTHNTQ